MGHLCREGILVQRNGLLDRADLILFQQTERKLSYLRQSAYPAAAGSWLGYRSAWR